ncbi:MAG: hydrogenase [Desulfovibrio sp.]|nr:hydrogenase [Desulfovibrio sp.]
MHEFDYREAVALNEVPVFTAEALGERMLEHVRDGWRVIAYFGLPEAGADGAAGLCCVLAHDAEQRLAAARTAPLTAFPSLAEACPQVELFEREIYEEWGILPEGHPWLKPVRRSPDAPGGAGRDFYRVDGSEVHEVGVGPVHAGIIEPGHFRFQCYGEIILHLEIALGYQHRALMELLRPRAAAAPVAALRLAECAAGDSSVAHATALCVLRERLLGLGELSERCQRLRRAGLELERLANHCGDLGAIAGDTGFLPTSSWNGRIRGDFLNLTATLCGNRFGRGLLAYGGAAWGLSPDECADMAGRLTATGRDAAGSAKTMFASSSVGQRMAGTGQVTEALAREIGLVGVAARASGLPRDARFHAPLSSLPQTAPGPRTERTGDVFARAAVRRAEMEDSLTMVGADLDWLGRHPEDAAERAQAQGMAKAALAQLPPLRLAVAQVEGWRGEICHVGVTGPGGDFLALRVVDPSFHNWTGMALAMRGGQISDFPLCNKSFNLSYCGYDL